MRPLTFRGYLATYVQSLAGQRTLSVSKLSGLASSEPRLVEPLLLWAVTSGHRDRLTQLVEQRPDLAHELDVLTRLQQRRQLESSLAKNEPTMRVEYSKVWSSYVARRDAHLRDTRLKLAARERALALEATKNVTRYRMAKDLGLNPGNLHAYLTEGNAGKLSLDRAYGLVRYLDAA
jgi:hypothetical protein